VKNGWIRIFLPSVGFGDGLVRLVVDIDDSLQSLFGLAAENMFQAGTLTQYNAGRELT
jgi:hypothetical protein